MPVQHLLVLLVIARHEAQEGGFLITQLAEKAGMTMSSTSRAVRQLSKTNRQLGDGLDLVVAATNWANQREKHLRLTHRGKTVVAQYLKTINPKE